jgi:glycosyltransferase involved in cell wall biosynthesis
LACGVPLIISVDGEARRLVEKAGGGIFVEPESVEQMEASILELYQSNELRAALGDSGHAFVQREYDRQRIATNYHRHLTEVWTESK